MDSQRHCETLSIQHLPNFYFIEICNHSFQEQILSTLAIQLPKNPGVATIGSPVLAFQGQEKKNKREKKKMKKTRFILKID
jgi:hypothetical protein